MEVREETYYLDRIRSGDKEAFSWVVDQYKDLVYTLCLRMLSDGEDAADAAQEVFVKAFRSLDTFRKQSKFSTWIYRITYNHCISVIRKKVKVIDLVDEFHEDQDPESELDGFESLSRKERSQYLQAAIEALPETDAVVVTLFYYEELSLEEIADITGLSSGNIRIKLHRSRKKLYQVLKQQLKSELNTLV